MIELLVFYFHVVAAATMFTRRWQDEGLSEGVLVLLFMGLIFFVGWSITTFLMKLVMDKDGLGILFNRDAASLLLLTVGEAALYYFYLRDEERTKRGERKTINEAEN